MKWTIPQEYLDQTDRIQELEKEVQRLNRQLAVRIQDGSPRQDSLNDQLRDLASVANELGMYDAADFLRNRILKDN